MLIYHVDTAGGSAFSPENLAWRLLWVDRNATEIEVVGPASIAAWRCRPTAGAWRSIDMMAPAATSG